MEGKVAAKGVVGMAGAVLGKVGGQLLGNTVEEDGKQQR